MTEKQTQSLPVFYVISWIMWNYKDVSKNMIESIISTETIFVENKEQFLKFLADMSIIFSWKIIEMDDKMMYLETSKPIIIKTLLEWKNIAVFESSWTACFRDPWFELLDFAYTLGKKIPLSIVPIIWNWALQTAISVSWLFMDQYVFLDGIHESMQKDIEQYDIPLVYFNHIRKQDRFFKVLWFLKWREDIKVFVWINLWKMWVPFSNFLLRGTGDYVLEKLSNTFSVWEVIPDLVMIFDKNFHQDISYRKLKRNHNI